MNIIFTICSVNYLASAKCLRQSLNDKDPESKFIYIIADKINDQIKADYFEGVEYIEVEDLEIPNLNELISTYNIIEFNTAIKPFAVKYLAKKYNAKKIIYFDPDIIVFNSLDLFWTNLNNYDFIVTPHITEPITNELFYPHQQGALNTGVFNLGFIAININENTTEIINWWAYHMREHGHSNSSLGEFYDQKIMNLLPIFSDKLLIEKHSGCNVAGWNIHEREITKNNDGYLVNNKPLIFYHFSGLVSDPSVDLISKYNNLKLSQHASVKEIVSLYRDSLLKNDQKKLSQLNCAFDLKPNIHTTGKWQMFKHKIKTYFK
jgi:lipopolysaccharide biosynthesis glycosyltransferase